MTKKTTAPIRAAAYYRASTEIQEIRQTIETQRHYVRRYLDAQGVTIAHEYLDDGVTGAISMTERPLGNRCLEDARSGLFNTLYIYAVDRLGREAEWVLQANRLLKVAGVRLRSVTQAFESEDLTGNFVLVLLAGQAELEKGQIVSRFQAGLDRCAEEGYWLGGKVPYGYRLTRDGKRWRLTLCDEPIPGFPDWSPKRVISYAFDRAHQDRATCWAIAKELQAFAIPTYWVPDCPAYPKPTHGLWLPTRVRNILTNPTYAGTHTFGKSYTGRIAKREPIPRACPALVTPEVFAHVAEQLTQNRSLSSRNSKMVYLLRGLIHCGCCGRKYVGCWQHQGKRVTLKHEGERCYHCLGRFQSRSPKGFCRGAHWVKAELLEADVKSVILDAIQHPEQVIDELHTRMADTVAVATATKAAIREIDAELRKNEAASMEYLRMRAQGLIPSDAILLKLQAELREQEDTLRSRLSHLHQTATAHARVDQRRVTAVDTLASLAAQVQETYTDDQWRHLIELLVESITVHSQGEGMHKRATAEIVLTFSHEASSPIETLTLTRSCNYWQLAA